MPGYDKKEGFYRKEDVSDDELWSAFTSLFSSQVVMVSSYKYGLLKSIIDNLYNVDSELKLTFDQLFYKFSEIYWNLVLKYNLKQQAKKETSLEKVLNDAVIRYSIPEGVMFENLTPEIKYEIVYKVKQNCKRYVLGALYEDTKELFYSFSKSMEWIQIKPQMYEFLCKHKVFIEKLNYYEWARFLERVNTDDKMDHLINKIDESAKRINLSYYRNILFNEFENKCFYCGKTIPVDKADVDHFIPWSFIKDDNLWNFVIACHDCNIRKRDKLANKRYLDALIVRNSIMVDKYEDMNNYRNDKLLKIYSWAIKNGYDRIWQPK